MRHAWRYVKRTASIKPTMASCYTIKTCALVVATAYMRAPLAHRSSHNKMHLANAEKWTSAHSVQAAQQRAKRRSTRSTAPIIAEGKLPLCAEMCSTKALLAGDAQDVADIFRQRVVHRGHKDGAWLNNPQASTDNLAYDAARKG